MIRRILLISILLILTLYTVSYAEFIGPSDVLTTTWGNGNGQVGLQYGDTEDKFPWKLAVSPAGRIAICDIVNKRVVIFKSDGSFERNINILETSVAFDSNDALYYSAPFMKFDNTGTMVFEQNVGFDEIYVSMDNKVIGYDRDKKTYSLYSPTGQLIRTTTERPLELGKVKEKKTAAGYTYTVQYPDIANPNITKTYTVSVEGVLGKFMGRFQRDTNGNLYGIFGKNVVRFDDTGSIIAQMQIPVDVKGERVKDPFGASTRRPIIAEYGEPMIAPNGDVYTWKRTPTTYSIIKWTWKP